MRKLAVWAFIAATTLSAHAQKTLEERIREADAARAAKEALEKAGKEAAGKPAATPAAAGNPTVVIGPDAARYVGAAQGQGGPGGARRPDMFGLLQIKGFADEPGGLEATIALGEMRFVVTKAQPQLVDGWQVANITPSAVDLVKGTVHQTLRFGTTSVMPPAPAASAAPAPRAQVR